MVTGVIFTENVVLPPSSWFAVADVRKTPRERVHDVVANV
jgi:hypothetical protein